MKWIVLTGGPCGGKTTAITYLQARLPELGIYPIVVPEVGTLLFNSGIRYTDVMDDDQLAMDFETKVIELNLKMEEQFAKFASTIPGVKKVLLCDRGVLDAFAYAKDEWHTNILARLVKTHTQLKGRYDAIFHLETMAYANRYVLDNPARYESAEDAIKMDKRTYQVWSRGISVPHYVFEHEAPIEEKILRITNKIIEFVGEDED